MRPRASLARKAGQTFGGGGCLVAVLSVAAFAVPVFWVMPPSFPAVKQRGLDVSELLGEQLAGRAARQVAELAGHVRLVVVAAVRGQAGQEARLPGGACGAPAQQGPARPVEPHDPGRLLRGKAR